MKNNIIVLFLMLAMTATYQKAIGQYTMPLETEEHEGTWLQWPHNYLYPPFYRDDLKVTFVEMTRELIKGERVFIIAYDDIEKDYIIETLTNEGVALDQVDFYIYPTDDCWVRDNGPIFVYDDENNLHLLDWGFNGWGNDTPYDLCNAIPQAIATDIALPSIDLNEVVLEGGAIEIDGNGSFMATKSSILGDDRNPNLSHAEVEEYLNNHLGVSNFIWLDGVAGLEITDMHIDGFVKFHDSNTIVTMSEDDLTYWEVPDSDIAKIMNAQDIDGNPYNHLFLPLSQNNVTTTWGQNLGYKGSYINYYVANAVVLVPAYNDPNDAVAISILQDLYPDKEVVGIDVRNLYSNGGMVHCVTQQQPKDLATSTSTVEPNDFTVQLFQNQPNPVKDKTTIEFTLDKGGDVELVLTDVKGIKVQSLLSAALPKGRHQYTFNLKNIKTGSYTYSLIFDRKLTVSKQLIIQQ